MKGTKNGARSRAMAVAAVSAALLIPLATFGGPALARSGAALAEYAYGSGSGQYQYGSGKAQYRVTICHVTHGKKKSAHTITVSSRAVRAHLRHGDHLAACTGNETRPAKHGKSGEHGKSDDHGKPAASSQQPSGKDHKKGK